MRVIVNPKYAHLQKEIEEIPRSFQEKGDVVYDGRNVLKRIGLGSIDVVVKSFKKPHIINRVVYSFFRQSKAERSYIYSMEIQQHGFDTPEPVAMDGKVEGNEDKLSAFARYTAALHQAGILHLDYSPGNILIHQNDANEYSFSLVDVNRMQLLSDIDCDTVCRNMCRLCISREVLTYIMTEYASLRGWDVESTVSLALRYSDQFFTHYIYRRAARKEKERHIVSLILFFRLYRSVRKFFSWEPHISRFLLKKEKHIYDTYLCKYDYCELLSADYQ